MQFPHGARGGGGPADGRLSAYRVTTPAPRSGEHRSGPPSTARQVPPPAELEDLTKLISSLLDEDKIVRVACDLRLNRSA
jgi:hypothetical protein